MISLERLAANTRAAVRALCNDPLRLPADNAELAADVIAHSCALAWSAADPCDDATAVTRYITERDNEHRRARIRTLSLQPRGELEDYAELQVIQTYCHHNETR